MSGPPLISVIVPVFNAGTTLEKTLLSIIRQDFNSFEIILVDGGSTDQSTEIEQRYKSWLKHLVCEPDRGVYDAMNKGIEKSVGEWLYFIGADDELASENVFSRFFVNNHAASGIDILFGSVINVGIRNKLVPTLHTSSFGPKLRWKNTLHHQSAFFRRSLFHDSKYNISYKVLADYDFHLHCLKTGVRAKFHPAVVARCGASGVSKKFTWSLYAEELRIKKKQLSIFYFLLNIPWICAKYLAKNLS